MILYMLTLRPSSAGDGIETLFCADFVFQGLKSFSLEKLQEYFRERFPRHIKYLYSANIYRCMLGALSDVLAALDWVQPDIPFLGEMYVNSPYSSNRHLSDTSSASIVEGPASTQDTLWVFLSPQTLYSASHDFLDGPGTHSLYMGHARELV